MNKKRGLWLSIAAALFLAGNSLTVLADSSISSVRVRFQNQYDQDGSILEPDISASGSGYEIDSVEWTKSLSDWKPGTKVTATITLVPEDGYSFGSSYSSQKVIISGADYTSAKRDDDGRLQLKVKYCPVVQLGETDKAGWSDAAKTKAVWKKVPHATAYQLRLYRNGDEYVTTLTLEGTSVDLSEYITREASYYYEVRATSKNSSDAICRRNGEYVRSADATVEDFGEAGGRWSQTLEGYRYTDANGVDAAGGWRYILGIWYYFDAEGYAVTGWQSINDQRYYMDTDCRMVTGWLVLEDKTYYMDNTGAMKTGWLQLSPTEWYYFNEDGTMAVNTEAEGYILGADGKMQ